MNFIYLATAVASSPAEKVMHIVHEVVGQGVFIVTLAALVLGGARTYVFYRKAETALTAAIDRNSLLRTLTALHRNYFGPAYRAFFVLGVVGLCGAIYHRFEVAIVDRLSYLVAGATRKLSELLYTYVDVGSIDRFSYFVAGATRKLSDVIFKYGEIGGIDKLNYCVAEGAVELSSRFRKTHTGVISYNMSLVLFAFVVLLISLLCMGMIG